MVSDADDVLMMVLDSANSFLAEQHDRARLRIGEAPPESAIDPGVWRQMAELGWLGLGLPEPLGGAGLGLSCSAALCERFGHALLPEPFIAAALMPGALLAACPPGAERDRLAAALASGKVNMTLGWQEAAGQFDVTEPQAILENGRLSGRKLFVPASLPDMTCLVVAREAGELIVVPVAIDAAGVTATGMRMGDGSRMAEIMFDQVVTAGAVLARGPAAVHAVEAALDQAQVALAAQLAGLAEGAHELSLDYLRTRVQFGRPIGTFQALQHRAVDLYARVALAKASWRRAATLQETAPATPAARAAISAAKATAIRAARDTTAAGVQFFGAMGFTEEADIGLYLRSALHWSSWLGNETAHRRSFAHNMQKRNAA